MKMPLWFRVFLKNKKSVVSYRPKKLNTTPHPDTIGVGTKWCEKNKDRCHFTVKGFMEEWSPMHSSSPNYYAVVDFTGGKSGKDILVSTSEWNLFFEEVK